MTGKRTTTRFAAGATRLTMAIALIVGVVTGPSAAPAEAQATPTCAFGLRYDTSRTPAWRSSFAIQWDFTTVAHEKLILERKVDDTFWWRQTLRPEKGAVGDAGMDQWKPNLHYRVVAKDAAGDIVTTVDCEVESTDVSCIRTKRQDGTYRVELFFENDGDWIFSRSTTPGGQYWWRAKTSDREIVDQASPSGDATYQVSQFDSDGRLYSLGGCTSLEAGACKVRTTETFLPDGAMLAPGQNRLNSMVREASGDWLVPWIDKSGNSILSRYKTATRELETIEHVAWTSLTMTPSGQVRGFRDGRLAFIDRSGQVHEFPGRGYAWPIGNAYTDDVVYLAASGAANRDDALWTYNFTSNEYQEIASGFYPDFRSGERVFYREFDQDLSEMRLRFVLLSDGSLHSADRLDDAIRGVVPSRSSNLPNLIGDAQGNINFGVSWQGSWTMYRVDTNSARVFVTNVQPASHQWLERDESSRHITVHDSRHSSAHVYDSVALRQVIFLRPVDFQHTVNLADGHLVPSTDGVVWLGTTTGIVWLSTTTRQLLEVPAYRDQDLRRSLVGPGPGNLLYLNHDTKTYAYDPRCT